MNKNIILIIFSLILFSFSVFYYQNILNKVTPQCERAYNNYVDYIKEINKVALDNGFGEQSIVSLQRFCKN